MYAYRQSPGTNPDPNHAMLPEGVHRGDVERLLRRVAPSLGLSPGQSSILLIMIDETRPSDWTRPDREPVCFTLRINNARISNQTTRSVRRTEDQLVQLSLARKEEAANGRRGRHCAPDGHDAEAGIFFTPLFEAIPDLPKLREQLDQDRFDALALKQKISAARRMVKLKLQRLDPDEASPSALQDRIASCPTRFEATVDTSELRTLLKDVTAVDDSLEQLTQCKTSESDRPDSDVRRHIQHTNPSRTVGAAFKTCCKAHSLL